MNGDIVYDVLVIGGGPAGLAAATRLKQLGISKVAVLEREASAGGVPRHCGHPPFGIREFGLLLSGPSYARRLVATAEQAGVEIRLSASVVTISDHGAHQLVTLTTPSGMETLLARRILLATGIREKSRAARLLSGERPLGVINTGALQAYTYLEHLAPFRRPVIVGTELVALSAILTCRAAGAHPVAMIEEGKRTTAQSPLFTYPRLLGIPVLTRTRIIDIEGSPGVTGVVVEDGDGKRRAISCDGVILTGQFVPEAHLARHCGLAIDPSTGGPVIDQYGRCSHPSYFAAGNLLRPVETAGWSFREGKAVAHFIASDLDRGLASPERAIPVLPGPKLRYAVPQRFIPGAEGFPWIQLRVDCPVEGKLVSTDRHGRLLYSKSLKSLPERRITMPVDALRDADGAIQLEITGKV